MQPLFLAETCNVPREKIRYIRLFASRGMSSICAKEMSAPLFFFQKALGELVDIDKPRQNTYLAQNIYSGVAKPIIKPRSRNTGKRRMLVGSQIAVLPPYHRLYAIHGQTGAQQRNTSPNNKVYCQKRNKIVL